jgi:AraC-like DNA-binding protein
MEWGDDMQAAVERAITTMWERYDEPLSLADIADTAILSKYYFSRVFRTLTGTSPGRFLTAIRLCKAKHLLLETSLSVTDISYKVGYNSLGTFTSRFTRSVSVSPARYRAMSRAGLLGSRPSSPTDGPIQLGAIRGLVGAPETGTPLRIYVAAFRDPIAQGLPGSCDILDSPGPYQLDALPDGTWFIRVAVVAVEPTDSRPWDRRPLFVGGSQPLAAWAGDVTEVNIMTRPTTSFDLPILLALPELDGARSTDDALAIRRHG